MADDKKADAHDRTVKRAASSEAAQSVAEAVKRVADAAVAAVSHVDVGPLPELTASGVAGGRITINGSGFGPSGTVTVGGAQIKTLGWSTTRIEGLLHDGVHGGEVCVHVDDKTVRRGMVTL